MGLFSSLLGKNSDYTSDYKRFKKAIGRNPNDYALKAEFIKFCLLNRFTNDEAMEDHVAEVLRLFDTIANADSFDLQCHYLVGKYYQETNDFRKAYRIYLNAIKRFNQHVAKNPELKSENVELAYSVALNLMALQSDPVDPNVEVCFKIIRKSFPLHLKRIEVENEMAKPAPNLAHVKQLKEEILRLKAEEEKASQEALEEKAKSPSEPSKAQGPSESPKTQSPSEPKPVEQKEQKGFFSKLFNELSPGALGLTALSEMNDQKMKAGTEKGEKKDSLQMAPFSQSFVQGSAFMAYHNNRWEGPYTPMQLRSLGSLKPATWVCRFGSQQVVQAYEVPELQSLFQQV